MLEAGYHSVPAGHTASVVTHLEMSAPPALRPAPVQDLTLERVQAPDPERYLALFRRVGADYLWFGRLMMDKAELSATLHDPKVHVFIARAGEEDAGLLELDFRQEGECELAYFGMAPDHVGGGGGRWLMNHALNLAWAEPINRMHVHTCTLDHPRALDFYIRSGFIPYKREIETARDPRLSGHLPETAAPNIPLL